ncbi:dTDP-glucose 4,6-dehydratase [uncultured Turicimonas sp.]|uniref:dTDP-glucose 4,6-dehydratase n=1 Tax=uncultured Turicimonas sp. TaxID=1918607 RepID=UPI0028040E32|nr:dTDP-glucose 4,6-dehydratase [uncultured Turicimonas sp.]
MSRNILVTGGAGFIGSCFVVQQVEAGNNVLVLDKLTYAGHLVNLEPCLHSSKFSFAHGDIGDAELVARCLKEFRPDAIVNFAAESHVDRSIHSAEDFVRTNVLGTEQLLRTTKDWWQELEREAKKKFRFLHISTDEVYGSLDKNSAPFTENSPYAPNSPYSASKASSDFFVRSYFKTYGLPTLISNCSNNYGPRQYPEKLIPLMVLNAVSNKPLPIYGTGLNIRDWIYVEDHCEALDLILSKGRIGESYNIGGECEKSNLEIVHSLCEILDEVMPKPDGTSYSRQIKFVADRPGHDFRYAIDSTKVKKELGWTPRHSFSEALRNTVLWYLNNSEWTKQVMDEEYRKWLHQQYQGLDAAKSL